MFSNPISPRYNADMKNKYPYLQVIWLLLIVCLVTACSSVSDGLSGEVVKIADGDTFTLLTRSKEQVKVRLAEIDTPERGQPYYQKAKDALADKVFQQIVQIEVVDTDRYGRTIGKVYLNGTYVNARMVAEGHAWVYRDYSDDPKMLELESEAQQQSLGLWALPEQIPPWEWRAQKRAD